MAQQISPAVQSFVQAFYAASDEGPAKHNEYLQFYHKDGTLIMGPNTFQSHPRILEFRIEGWRLVEKRKHTVKGVFLAQGGKEDEIMLYGTVDYLMKDGSNVDGTEWAARMVFDRTDEPDLKLLLYQVYLTRKNT